ncbi:MAG: 23S rRNA pseudouridine(2605) synthase RluB [Gammaproteobacteria bacterium]|nr:MAG: 23S rRNA pseudouridine(2605) synthase RluB [Gammaproteobacteria bacterium]
MRSEKPAHKPERLQKIMATAGLGSRRALERQIKSGEVRVNDSVAGPGQHAAPGDRITYAGKSWRVVTTGSRQRSLVYNKKTGEITTRSDPQERRTVFDRLPRISGARWIAVGRLDINTSGLLLMTTDGELANAMMHPSNRVDREYACRIFGEVSAEQIEKLKKGVTLADGPAHFSDIVASGGSEGNHWYHVTLLEGRNREVRRLWESQGVTVSRLKRVRYGAVFLPKRLRMGEWSELTARDHQVLREDVGLDPLPVQLGLAPEKGHREADKKSHRKSAHGKKSTRYKNVDAHRPPAGRV